MADCKTYIEQTITNTIQNNNPFDTAVITKTSQQNERIINFPRLTAIQKEEIDLQAAMWCYMGNHPFTMFDNEFGKQFLKSLNPVYEPPSRKLLAGRLLDSVYSTIKKRTEDIIAAMPNINISSDESSNIKSARICNISVHSESGSLHYLSEDILAKRMTAAGNADWLRTHLLNLSNQNPSRINSVTTDTCDTMFSMWEEFESYEEFKHCLFIPCDSHGIQLLIKDLLKIPVFSNIIDQAQNLAKAFRKAHLQYARLRENQLHFYGNHQSLILSVITRWGTQLRLIQSILKSKDALKRYASDYGDLPAKERIKRSAIDAIRSRDFWMQLESIRELLQPLDEELKKSESGKSHLGHVLSRWLSMLRHLVNRKKTDFAIELESFLVTGTGTFAQRYQRQIKPIHVAAYYFLPESRNKEITAQFDSQIQTFLRRYTTSEDDYSTICFEFESFRAQEPPFEYGRRCWTLVDHPKLFWHSTFSHTKLLGKLAYRVFSCPVNSVASEHAFSIQNLIHIASRNPLHSERADKLVYMHINGRRISQFDNKFDFASELKSKPLHDLTP